MQRMSKRRWTSNTCSLQPYEGCSTVSVAKALQVSLCSTIAKCAVTRAVITEHWSKVPTTSRQAKQELMHERGHLQGSFSISVSHKSHQLFSRDDSLLCRCHQLQPRLLCPSCNRFASHSYFQIHRQCSLCLNLGIISKLVSIASAVCAEQGVTSHLRISHDEMIVLIVALLILLSFKQRLPEQQLQGE